MARIEDILSKYTEETINNVIKATLKDRSLSIKNDRHLIVELLKIESDEMLFSYGNVHFRVVCEDTSMIKSEISPDGVEKYNYLFWIDKKDVQNNDVSQ